MQELDCCSGLNEELESRTTRGSHAKQTVDLTTETVQSVFLSFYAKRNVNFIWPLPYVSLLLSRFIVLEI